MAAVDVLILEQARKEVREAIDDMTQLNAKIIEIAKNVNKFTGKPFTNPIPSDLPKRVKESSKWISDLNAANREAERLSNNVARSKARLAAAESNNAKQLARLREETRLNNIALKEEGVLSSRLVGAYKKLTVRRNQASRTLKNLIASERASNKEIRRAQREFDRLDNKVRKADRATNDFRRNVGNYSSAFGKASLALRNFVGVLGLYSGFEIARQVFEQVKALNGLNLALEQVTQTASAYNEAQQFISDVAEEAGADIFSLTSAYTKFLASAKTTTLTLEQTNNIFRQTAKAAGVLGLSTEDTNGAFRALEQILSKGNVQAEEIRGQLGERLPGAFQILARSMGLTTAELSKQLELGNVLSDEVLPGFAEELERTYNLGMVERVETLAASQTRLGNAWKEFLASVEGGEGTISRVFKSILDSVTEIVEYFKVAEYTFEDINRELSSKTRSDAFKEETELIKKDAEIQKKSIEEIAESIKGDYVNAVEEQKKVVEEVSNRLDKANKLNDALGGSADGASNAVEKLNEKLLLESNILADKEGKLDAVNRILDKTTDNTNKYDDAIKTLIPKLQKISGISFGTLNEEFEKNSKEAERMKEALEGIYKFVQGYDLDNLGNPMEIFGEKKIDLGFQLADDDKLAQMARGLTSIVENTYGKINKEAISSAETQKEIFKGIFDTFSQYYGIDMTAFQKLLQGKEASLDDYASAAKSIAQALTESQIIKYENERVANQEKLDAILANETYTAEQKTEAQERFAKEEKRIRIKQAKAERDAVLIQIAIDTAAAVAKALLNAAALSSNPFTAALAPNAYAQAALAATVGVVQAGFVLAQPLPRFFKGTKDAPEGLAWTDEKGAEIHTDKKGNIKDLGSDSGARLKMLESGDKIYTASESQNILKNSILNDNSLTQQKIDEWIMRKSSPVVISTDGIKKEIRQGIREGFRGLKNPNFPDNYTKY